MDNQPFNPQPETPSKPKLNIIIPVAIVTILGIGALVYFLFLAPKSEPTSPAEPETPAVSDSDSDQEEIPKASSEKPEAERLADYDHEIEIAGNAEDRFALIIDNVMVLMSYGKTNEALARLSSIDASTLDDYSLYRLYSAYTYVYSVLGDEAKTDYYFVEATSALDRYNAANGGTE